MTQTPGPDVSVRVAWPADGAAIAAIQLRGWQQRYGEPLADLLEERGLDPALLETAWRESLAHPPEARRRALVALVHDRVVGFALTGPAADPDADPKVDGELAELTVDPEQTRQGHGSRLVQAGVDTLRADGFTRAVTWVDATDDVLRAFLAGSGWAPDSASRELADEAGVGSVKQVRLHCAL
ncbi:GNAT family N-acetyltransferase [Nocardioides panacisoli]|uniref:N-acetyltransferase domain-containing protein n=1 Tax=Nocardioides panacisoli TaxID=627624 RepID=A0ABP7IA32_9ACTN